MTTKHGNPLHDAGDGRQVTVPGEAALTSAEALTLDEELDFLLTWEARL